MSRKNKIARATRPFESDIRKHPVACSMPGRPILVGADAPRSNDKVDRLPARHCRGFCTGILPCAKNRRPVQTLKYKAGNEVGAAVNLVI